MLIDFITMIALAAALVGVYMLINRASGRRLPKGMLPVCIGIGLIVFAVWNEYSWYGRVTAKLPENVTVVLPVQERSVWRPWTYLFPVTTRFIAIDGAAVLRSEAKPELVRTDAILVQRWARTQRVPVAFDCTAHKRADLSEGTALAADGSLEGGDWVQVPPDDPMMKAACQGG